MLWRGVRGASIVCVVRAVLGSWATGSSRVPAVSRAKGRRLGKRVLLGQRLVRCVVLPVLPQGCSARPSLPGTSYRLQIVTPSATFPLPAYRYAHACDPMPVLPQRPRCCGTASWCWRGTPPRPPGPGPPARAGAPGPPRRRPHLAGRQGEAGARWAPTQGQVGASGVGSVARVR